MMHLGEMLEDLCIQPGVVSMADQQTRNCRALSQLTTSCDCNAILYWTFLLQSPTLMISMETRAVSLWISKRTGR